MRKGLSIVLMLIISAMLIRSANASGFRNAAVQTGNPDGVTKPREEVLTNDSIVKLVKHGLTEDAIINLINSGPEQFSFAANAITVLQKAGVSEKIISAMVNRDLRGSTLPLAPPPLAATAPRAMPAAATIPEPGTKQRNQPSGTAVGRLSPETVTEAAQGTPALSYTGYRLCFP